MSGLAQLPAVTIDDVNKAISAAGVSYVAGSSITPLTLNTLLANYPPSTTLVGKYARVSDLYGSVDEVLRCRFDGTNYRWVPQRENYNLPTAATSGVVSVLPLFTAPTLQLASTLTGNVNVALSSANAYVGQRQTVIAPSSLGLYNMTVSGLVGAGTVPMLQGGVKQFEYSPSGWFQIA